MDAFSYNFKCVVPHDAVYDRTPTVHQVNLFDLAQKYADVLSTEEVAGADQRSFRLMPPAGSTAIDRAGHTLSDKVEAILREQIIGGGRAPGDRLNEVEIAAELAVSRGPLREAMQRLAATAWSGSSRTEAAFVRVLDADEVRALFEVRVSLERTAAALAADRADEDEIAGLRELIESSRGAVEGAAPSRTTPSGWIFMT